MTAPKPIPEVPAALVGLYIGAPVSVRDGSDILHGLVYSIQETHATDGGPISVVAADGSWSFEGALYSDVALLLDSPLSLCHAARWLAVRHGCDPGATAPWWTHYPRGVFCPGDNDPLRPDFWVLLCENGGCVWFVDADEPDDLKVDQDGNRYIFVAGLKGSTLPASLAAACVAVGGAG